MSELPWWAIVAALIAAFGGGFAWGIADRSFLRQLRAQQARHEDEDRRFYQALFAKPEFAALVVSLVAKYRNDAPATTL